MTAWIDEAPCRGATHIMYPPGDRPRPGRTPVKPRDPWQAARTVCATCPHTDACLERTLAQEADTPHDRHGMAGGMTPTERANEAARRPAPPTGRVLQPIVHGTNVGFQLHYRRGEVPCHECRKARAEYMAAYRARRRVAA